MISIYYQNIKIILADKFWWSGGNNSLGYGVVRNRSQLAPITNLNLLINLI